jgi:isopentenyl phosphate kinase
MNWSEQVVLVTGGTGSFGKKFVEIMHLQEERREPGGFRVTVWVKKQICNR